MHVIRNNGQGPAVVLVHGHSLSADTWCAQLNAPDLGRYHLLAVDLPGHGRSAWHAQDELYTLEGFAETIAAFVAPLGPVVLVGHALGGHVAIRAAAKANNVRALLLCSTPPLRNASDMERAFAPGGVLGRAFEPCLSHADAAAMAEACTWPGCTLIPALAGTILDTDPRVRADLGEAIAHGRLVDEQALLKRSGVPTAVVHGALDGRVERAFLQDLAPLFWRQRIHELPDAGHMPQLQRPAAFNSLLAELIDAHAHA